jgi:hypothetical protein
MAAHPIRGGAAAFPKASNTLALCPGVGGYRSSRIERGFALHFPYKAE